MSATMVSFGLSFLSAASVKNRHHDHPVLAFVEVGALRMLDVHNLSTVSMRWSEWEDPRLILIVLHSPHWREGPSDLPPESGNGLIPPSQGFDYAAYARLLGLPAFAVHSQHEFSTVWEAAGNPRSPVLIDVLADPHAIDWDGPDLIMG